MAIIFLPLCVKMRDAENIDSVMYISAVVNI